MCELCTVYMFQIVSAESLMLKPTKQSLLDILLVSRVYDLDKEFVVSRDVQFFEKKFDHFDEKPKINKMMLIKQI